MNKEENCYSINDLFANHIPLHINYCNNITTVYVSNLNNELYININSIALPNYPIDKWKRGVEIKKQIEKFDLEYNKLGLLSFYSFKNKGTYISVKKFSEHYFNWFGCNYEKEKNNNKYIGFGTYLSANLENIFNEYKEENDAYFIKFAKTNCLIRSNRETNFINLTDMVNSFGRDIRSFKKNSTFVKYNSENPDHYVSGNSSTDEFGMKVTYGHPNLALILLDWLSNKSEYDDKDKKKLKNFIELQLKIMGEKKVDKLKKLPNMK